MLEIFTPRDWATATWFAVLLAYAILSPSVRPSVLAAIRAFLHPKILAVILAFAIWMFAWIFLASSVAVWQPSLLRDTIVWVLPAFGLIIASTRATSEPGYFRRRLAAAFGITLFVEFYVGLATFDYLIELALQPVLFLIVAASVLSRYRTDYQSMGRAANRLLALIVLVLLVPPSLHVLQNWTSIDLVSALRDLFLPVWLTLSAIPFLYGLTLLSAYERALLHMRFASPTKRVPARSLLALASSFGIDYRGVYGFAGNWPRELVRASSLRDGLEVIRRHRHEIEERRVAEQKEHDDLALYAGVEGTDADGRQLDRREFKETMSALERLSSAHMGWYRRNNRYQPDLVDRVADALLKELGSTHGVKMKVRRDGQAWYAWRRTPSGWCLGIGASGPPPDQRFYAGASPPMRYPGPKSSWGKFPHERPPDWE